MRATGFVFHELFLWHQTGLAALEIPPGLLVQPDLHIENPESKRRIRNLLDATGVLEKLLSLKPRAATASEIERAHARAYIEQIRALSDSGGGNAGVNGFADAPFGRGGFEIASLAAGGAIVLTRAVWEGRARNGYALLRPPGHHATRDSGMGFCLFNNVAVAAADLRAAGAARVAVVDWDVHHGNGTQSIFYGDDSVLTVSLHQEELYPPQSGAMEERGEGAGRGFNVNIPLPAGCGNGAYLAAIEEIVIPALRRFSPEIILVASGLDASIHDPLGRMMLTPEGYRRLTRALLAAADELCAGKIAMFHEGGYSPQHAPYCALAIIEEMSATDGGARAIFADGDLVGGQDIRPHQRARVREIRDQLGL